MVRVEDFDHTLTIPAASFDAIYLGDKTCLVSDYDFEAEDILQLREQGSTRVCEVEVTHVETLTDGVSLFSITLCA